jgi:hypothetical protein
MSVEFTFGFDFVFFSWFDSFLFDSVLVLFWTPCLIITDFHDTLSHYTLHIAHTYTKLC